MAIAGRRAVTRRPRPVIGIVAGGGLLALAVLLNLGRMSWVGRMSAEMTYDDVVYALAGDAQASLLVSSGLRATLANAIANPPHAPVTEALATVASLLGGPSTARVYLMNTLLIAALLVLFMRILAGRHWPTVLVGAALLLVSPLGYFLSDQYRPDTAYLVGLAATCLAGGSLARSSPQRRRVWIVATGALSGALLYLKPSYFVFSAICVVALGVVVLLVLIARRTGLVNALQVIALTALLALAVAVPFALVLLPGEIAYIQANILGENSEIWLMPDAWGSTTISVREAHRVLAWMVPVATAALLGGLAFAAVRRDALRVVRGAVLLAVAVASLIPVTLAHGPGVFVGSMPVGLAVLGALTMGFDAVSAEWGARLRDAPATAGSWRTVGLVVAGVAAVLVTSLLTPAAYTTPVGLRAPLSVNGRMLDAALDRCSADPVCDEAYTSLGTLPRILVGPSAEISRDSMQWEAVEEGWAGQVQRLPFLVDEADLAGLVGDADFIVVLGAEATRVNGKLPVNQVQDALRALLVADPAWARVAVPVVGERYELYVRAAIAPG